MSLDIYLELPKCCPSCGLVLFENNEDAKSVWCINITHNLNTMADKVGLYEVMWRPEEIKVKYAKDAIPHLEKGVSNLKENKESLLTLNPENGWGTYEDLLEVAESYLEACKKYQSAEIYIWR